MWQPPSPQAGAKGTACKSFRANRKDNQGRAEAKKLATAAIHVATATERQAPTGRPPKKCKFADVLNCTGLHPPWRCGAFGDKKPEDQTRIIKDNKLCPFCLLHDESEVCYSKVNKTKPACEEMECRGQHIQWLHELLKGVTEIKMEIKGEVNVVQGQEGWRTPDEAWMEDREEEEEEVHCVNLV
jgi:hypothetical protein